MHSILWNLTSLANDKAKATPKKKIETGVLASGEGGSSEVLKGGTG